mmetsp:Transcript_19434/g.45607  ORF Transcript_19434/g.45607 Transcript_19434/m.45607 type:complete len:261 (+) Transcript_19434:243-1025(+)
MPLLALYQCAHHIRARSALGLAPRHAGIQHLRGLVCLGHIAACGLDRAVWGIPRWLVPGWGCGQPPLDFARWLSEPLQHRPCGRHRLHTGARHGEACLHLCGVLPPLRSGLQTLCFGGTAVRSPRVAGFCHLPSLRCGRVLWRPDIARLQARLCGGVHVRTVVRGVGHLARPRSLVPRACESHLRLLRSLLERLRQRGVHKATARPGVCGLPFNGHSVHCRCLRTALRHGRHAVGQEGAVPLHRRPVFPGHPRHRARGGK